MTHQVHHVGPGLHVTGYGLKVAGALGVNPDRVFKTLVCSLDTRLAVAIVPVTGELDLKSLALALSAKNADLADPAVAERATGYVVGGISPIGQRQSLPTVIDQSAPGWDTIFISGGRRGLEIELTPADLLAATSGQFAPIGRSR
jgi:Cys-tRNA(Pro)/Cys-tRNA(Cys) deacylase